MKLTPIQDTLARIAVAIIIFVVVLTWGKPDQAPAQVTAPAYASEIQDVIFLNTYNPKTGLVETEILR